MRTITYQRLTGVGGGALPARGTLLQLLADVPYFFTFKLLPPLEVLNDFLLRGVADAGMSGGCRWEPFQITKEEWEELARGLRDDSHVRIEFVPPPETITTYADWALWTMTCRLGVPFDQHKALSDQVERWEREGDHLKAIEASERLADFLRPYLSRHELR